MNEDNPCPKCGASDLGAVIPRKNNKDEAFGPQGTRYRMHIALYSLELDRTYAWKCQSCGHEWPRKSGDPRATRDALKEKKVSTRHRRKSK